MRPLVALLLLAPLAGCIVDPPQEVDPASFAPESAEPEGAYPPPPPPETPPANATSPPPPPPPPPAPPAPPSPPSPPGSLYVVEHRFGNLTAGAGAASPDGAVCCVGAAAPTDESVTQVYAVPSGARTFVVELRWSALQEQTGFDLDLVVKAPDYRDAEPAAPSVPPSGTPEPSLYSGHRFAATNADAGAERYARIVVDDPAVLALAGDWTIEINPKGPAAQVPFELALTTATDVPLEEGYSAFG